MINGNRSSYNLESSLLISIPFKIDIESKPAGTKNESLSIKLGLWLKICFNIFSNKNKKIDVEINLH